MRRIFYIISLISLLFVTSCVKSEYVTEVNKDYKANYEAMWKIINENYCFLGDNYGYTKNVNWQDVYNEMMPKVEQANDDVEFFEIIGQSLDRLKDGHVWLTSPFNHHSCLTFYYDENNVRYPVNFYKGVNTSYLTYVFRTNNKIIYGKIERNGKKFAYIFFDDFSTELTNENLSLINPLVEECDGIIFDIRTNPGGSPQFALNMASYFFSEKTLVGYNVNKTGKGYNDVSDEPLPFYAVPSSVVDWSSKKTTLLVNRDVYSSGNLFASILRYAPNVTLVGGITGGGGGSPWTFYLPNGWLLMASSGSMILDANKVHIEPGVAPDVEVTLTKEDAAKGVDTIIEKAIEILSK